MTVDLRDWLSKRFDDILEAPRMYGELQAAEMQCLLCLEAIHFPENPRPFLARYLAFLTQRFPVRFYGIQPLNELVAGDEKLFVACLKDFRDGLGAMATD